VRWTAECLSKAVSDFMQSVQLESCTLHSRRKSAVVKPTELGVSNGDIKAITGHETDGMVNYYGRKADHAAVQGRQSAHGRGTKNEQRHGQNCKPGKKLRTLISSRLLKAAETMVPRARLERALRYRKQILSLPRLPIPPPGHGGPVLSIRTLHISLKARGS
jgi:hypothetical protein